MRYYGCKNKLLNQIEKAVNRAGMHQGAKFVDMFTGTTAVAQHFKKLGYSVIANDNLEFCYSFAKTYIELNDVPKFNKLKRIVKSVQPNQTRKKSTIEIPPYEQVLSYLNNLNLIKGFIYSNYCPSATNKLRTYFTDENGQKIDTIRTQINEWKNQNLINEAEYYYLITALLEAVNLISNVAGTYGACLKNWDKRALKKLTLVPPKIIPSTKKHKAFKEDANELVKKIRADILYLDPPYNTRQYISNYFILELIATGWFDKKIEVNGKTGLVYDNTKKSLYSQKTTARKVFDDLINKVKARFIIVSYNNEGIITEKQIINKLSEKGETIKLGEFKHKRYRSINQNDSDPENVDEKIFFVKTNLLKERFNRLDGANWLKYSFSIFKNIVKNNEEKKLKHPAMFPIVLAEKLIDIFTSKDKQLVIDPFVGSGSTIIASLKKNMRTLGIDLNKDYIKMAKNRIKNEYKEYNKKSRYKLITDNALKIDKYLKPNSADLCITSPPYWNILQEKRSADGKKIRNYGNSNLDFGNTQDYQQFLNQLKEAFEKVHKVMKINGICIVVVMDIRKKSIFYPFHSDIIKMMNEIGFKTRDIIIWDRQSEYNNLRPLGYPYSFIVNKIHEYILIFNKG
jgi:adenine-specific DNA methylase